MSIAVPVLGGTKTVATNRPVRTHDSPVFGRPSHPVKGNFNQCSRSLSLGNSSNAFLAPMAIESFCAPIKSTVAFCDVLSFNQERTDRSELSSVHCPLNTMM